MTAPIPLVPPTPSPLSQALTCKKNNISHGKTKSCHNEGSTNSLGITGDLRRAREELLTGRWAAECQQGTTVEKFLFVGRL